MGLPDLESQELNPTMLLLDGLYCEEENFDSDLGDSEDYDGIEKSPNSSSENDLSWEEDELVTLISKEKETNLGAIDVDSDRSVCLGRRETVDWVLRVNAHYGFSALTSVLAVNYFDRFIRSLCFQREKKPWMSQLAAVACLSLAAKVEETQVPLLLDLQVEDSKYVFEAKTIQRMELLVLSALQWKMHPVTPLSFFDHIGRRLGLKLKTHMHLGFLRRCERLLLCVITDSRFLRYLPSVLATAIMLHVIKEVEPSNAMDYQNQLMGVLKLGKDKVDVCYELIKEQLENCGYRTHKRKYISEPDSPNGIIDSYFSCDSSNDSSTEVLSVSSSPEPLSKKSRAHDQQMRLVPFNGSSMGLLSSPH